MILSLNKNANFFPLPKSKAENTFTTKNGDTWDDNIDIVATSRYKLNVDKHMRKILSSKPRWISSLIYLRNFKNSKFLPSPFYLILRKN
jgi:hypothetical protein